MTLDRGVLLSVFFLVGLGLVQVYSSSYIFATEVYGDGLFFFRKQLLFAMIFAVTVFVTAYISWPNAMKLGWVLWGIAILALMGTFIPGLGQKVGGAYRWLNLPMGFRFEPAELLKVTYPFVLSSLIADFARGSIDRKWLLKVGAPFCPRDFAGAARFWIFCDHIDFIFFIAGGFWFALARFDYGCWTRNPGARLLGDVYALPSDAGGGVFESMG